MWAMFCHLGALSKWTGVAFFAGIVVPLAIWLAKKDEMPLVDDQGKESLNFQISILIYVIVSGILCCALIGFVLLPCVIIFDVVATIVAGVKANQGIPYRYPLCIRFIS